MNPERLEDLELLQADCLEGKCGAKPQRIVADRCAASLRLYGMTPLVLKEERPEVYARLVAGHHRALIREALLSCGAITRNDVAAMWRAELRRRHTREFDSWDPNERAAE